MPLPEGLLEGVKDYLDITWTMDEAGERKLSDIIESGINDLNRIIGGKDCELDFTKNDLPLMLLKDYCRYARSNALDEFEENYQSEIIRLQYQYEVDKYEAEENANSDV